ncbi:hypothetical protein BRC91_06490 [Halobacteriales archaeon QS_4_62_28]|nr:MAG: hypothetical protein BRC91_06490 [Halobacteriales archaeon QS_4_62_28]
MWWLPLHTAPYAASGGVLALVTVGTLGSALLLGLGVAAFLRRQSRPYLLVALALGALFGRSAVAALSLTGTIDLQAHHLLEHALDVVLAALVIGAVYYARSLRPTPET